MDPITLAIFGGSMLANLFGAKKSSDAAKKAASQQLDYGRQANQVLSNQWGDTQRTLQPYLATGQDALMSLAGMVGLKPRLAQGAPVGMSVPGQNVAPQSLPTLSNAAPGYAGPRGPITMNSQPQMSQQMPPQGMPPQSLAGMGAMGQTVMMRAPNGQTSRVPAEQVAHYTQMGAQVIG